jgi:hypothetical protein
LQEQLAGETTENFRLSSAPAKLNNECSIPAFSTGACSVVNSALSHTEGRGFKSNNPLPRIQPYISSNMRRNKKIFLKTNHRTETNHRKTAEYKTSITSTGTDMSFSAHNHNERLGGCKTNFPLNG